MLKPNRPEITRIGRHYKLSSEIINILEVITKKTNMNKTELIETLIYNEWERGEYKDAKAK